MEDLYRQSCIRTFTGKYVNVLNPTADVICIEDIAHALSLTCRFGGHSLKFYSVAQHSVMCCNMMKEQYQLQALMHDASEAYLCDIPTPLKQHLSDYKKLEDRFMMVIANKFGFAYPLDEAVRQADGEMLEIEWHRVAMTFKTDDVFICWDAASAEKSFLKAFERLTKK